MPSHIEQASIWFRGPDFLWQADVTWPALPEIPLANADSDSEVKLSQTCASTSVELVQNEAESLDKLLSRYSSCAVAWLPRFVAIIMHPADRCFPRFLSVEELNQAKLSIVKIVQRLSFGEALSSLPNHEDFDKLFSSSSSSSTFISGKLAQNNTLKEIDKQT